MVGKVSISGLLELRVRERQECKGVVLQGEDDGKFPQALPGEVLGSMQKDWGRNQSQLPCCGRQLASSWASEKNRREIVQRELSPSNTQTLLDKPILAWKYCDECVLYTYLTWHLNLVASTLWSCFSPCLEDCLGAVHTATVQHGNKIRSHRES